MFNNEFNMPASSGSSASQDSSPQSLTRAIAKLYPHLDLQPKGQKPCASAPLLIPHPHCPNVRGHDHLAFWTSPAARSHHKQLHTSASAADIVALDHLLENSLAKGTLSTYGSGLAHWHSWCDS